MLSPKLSLALALGTLLFFIEAPMRCYGEEPIKIGSLYQCAHELRGTVYVVHEKEVMITGFDYDGTGPSTWFHAMKKGATAVSSANEAEYVQLASPDGTCNRLEKGVKYSDKNITLKLPDPIKHYATIGLLCYEFCNNFGHVYVPQDLTYPPAPADFTAPPPCTNEYKDKCTLEKTKHSALHPDCPTGSAKGMNMNTAMIPNVDKMLVGLSLGFLLIKANKNK